MPGAEDFYSIAELQGMSPSEFAEAQARGLRRPAVVAAPIEDRPAAAGLNLGSSVPGMPGIQAWQPPTLTAGGRNVWAAKKAGGTDFTCPSGQTCKLRPLSLEGLMMEGILDQVTRLEGLAQGLIDQASGLPPEKVKLPTREEFGELLKLVNKIVPMAVAEPRVYPDDYTDTVPENAIMVSDIDLMDRVSILNEALKGLEKLDNFRPAG